MLTTWWRTAWKVPPVDTLCGPDYLQPDCCWITAEESSEVAPQWCHCTPPTVCIMQTVGMSGSSPVATMAGCCHVAVCVSLCQQSLVVMTYLPCLLWIVPKEAKQGQRGRSWRWRWWRWRRRRSWLNNLVARGRDNTPGVLHIYAVKGVAELVVLLQRPSKLAVLHHVCLAAL